MRVFTQRFHSAIDLLPWEKPQLGQFPEFDTWVTEFSIKFPNTQPLEMHELDYKVWFTTPDPENDSFFIVGYYWGDESTLEAATHWCFANKALDLPIRRWVITCGDDEHPAVGSPSNLQIDDFLNTAEGFKKGHWRWSNPEIFVPYRP